tara:strand:+ start:8746 stop:9804 length:1059 start_codon:yes stop_codon:yes gene_type:complete
MDVDDEWAAFLDDDEINDEIIVKPNDTIETSLICPLPSDIYISTKTEIGFLNKTVDLKRNFWEIDLIPYDSQQEGVIKKQMKFISNTEEEFENLQNNLLKYKNNYIEESIISTIKADIGNKKYKDVRKVSIGISKKDMITNRTKKKGAFYNCFVLIIRIKENGNFKEYHAKIFNTGKVELPGIQREESLQLIKTKIENIILDSNGDKNYSFITQTLDSLSNNESILINSNFDCGYYLDRAKLFEILKTEYRLNTIYDSCTYPGVRCSFYYQDEITDGKQVSENDKNISFMIFRTGSVLIVGKCNEVDLHKIYNFIKDMLIKEFPRIVVGINENRKKQVVAKKTKKKIEVICP